MKVQGKVVNWNDDKGFGFVEPNGGGKRAFVHIKAFQSYPRRPVNGDLITYKLVRENDNRYKAAKVTFARDMKKSRKHSNNKGLSSFGAALTLLFCIGLTTLIAIGKLPAVIAGLYVALSLITYIAYAIDKSAAQKGRWRTKESTLHLFALTGGWPGAYFAQTKLRHKSSKKEFKRFYLATVLLNLAGLCWLLTEKGSEFLYRAVTPLLNV